MQCEGSEDLTPRAQRGYALRSDLGSKDILRWLLDPINLLVKAVVGIAQESQVQRA